VTKQIGLVATVSTTYNEPYLLARKFASLDHLSNGRAGWNIVTTAAEKAAANFSKNVHLAHDTRYERALEVVQLTKKLWDTWDDDALKVRGSNITVDEEKIHPVEHLGSWFAISGGLTTPRSLQGYPVLVQAGSSDAGRDFGARIAEVVFTAHKTLESAQAFYSDLKRTMQTYGRSPSDLKIMPGISTVLGHTVSQAREKNEFLKDLVLPEVGIYSLSEQLRHDFTVYPLEDPFPEIDTQPLGPSGYVLQKWVDLAKREKLTLREVSKRFASARSHLDFVGTPDQLADLMQTWRDQHGCDGFNLMPTHLPGGFEDFINLAVPILRERGLLQKEYRGRTLRDHLGLDRPRGSRQT
jgi:N-acetyl-S-(2-succino)cysteine monooxygenase